MRDWAVRQEENSKKYRCSSYKEEPHPKGGPPTPRAETQTLLEREPLWLPGWQRSCRAGNPSPSPSRVPREAVQRAGTLWRHTAMKPPNGGTTRSFWLLGAPGHCALQELGPGSWGWRSRAHRGTCRVQDIPRRKKNSFLLQCLSSALY